MSHPTQTTAITWKAQCTLTIPPGHSNPNDPEKKAQVHREEDRKVQSGSVSTSQKKEVLSCPQQVTGQGHAGTA